MLSAAITAGGQSRELTARLDKLQKGDSLEEWLILRMDYAAGRPDERIDFLMQTNEIVWRKPKTKAEKETWVNLLLNQGYYQLYNGNIIGSIDSYEDVNRFLATNPMPDLDVAEYIYKPLGNNYTRLGDYSSALFMQQQGLDFALQHKDATQSASFYNNMAISYRWLGNLAKAEKSALAGIKMNPKRDGLYALLRSSLADIYFEQNRLPEATANIDESIKILTGNNTESGSDYWLLSSYTLAGDIAAQKKEQARAINYYRRGLALIEKRFGHSRRREKAGLYNKIGRIFLAQGKSIAAKAQFNLALETLVRDYYSGGQSLKESQLYAENRLYDALAGRAEAYILTGENEDALQDFLLAMKVGDKTRNVIASQSDKIHLQNDFRSLVEHALEVAVQLWQTTREDEYSNKALMLVERAKARVLMDEITKNQQQMIADPADTLLARRRQLKQVMIQLETDLVTETGNKQNLLRNRQAAAYRLSLIEKEISKKYPAWHQEPMDDSLDVNQLLRGIPENMVVFDYFLGKRKGYNIVLLNHRVDRIEIIPDASKVSAGIAAFVQQYFRNGPLQMVNRPQAFFTASQEMYRLLIPKGIQTQNVLIIPDKEIGYLSFEGLIGEGKFTGNIRHWPFMIRRAQVGYAYSLSSWLIPAKKNTTGMFSGFFIPQSANGNIALPAAKLEQKYLTSELKGSFYDNEKAKLSQLKSAITRSSILHISTHSFPYGEDKIPALQLADGNFYLFQLGATENTPDLVVMSACRTADGLLASGEGILSLARGFAAIGTNGTIAGLWNVNDNSAAEQMRSFYRFLNENHHPEKSLYLTKLDWLEQPHSDPALLLPYYWASMIYTGKPQVIELNSSVFSGQKWMLVLLGILLTGLILFVISKKSFLFLQKKK